MRNFAYIGFLCPRKNYLCNNPKKVGGTDLIVRNNDDTKEDSYEVVVKE